MKRVLVAIDGGDSSLPAIEHTLSLLSETPDLEIHLLNVQIPVTGDVEAFVPHENITDFHRELGIKALASSMARLEAAGVVYHKHILVGRPADMIVELADRLKADLIITGARDLGMLAGMFSPSISKEVIHEAGVPVEVISLKGWKKRHEGGLHGRA